MLVRTMRRRRKHPDSETGDGAMQSLADLNVDGEVTESDPGWDESVQDGAVDLDLEEIRSFCSRLLNWYSWTQWPSL